MADKYRASVAILILCVGVYGVFNLSPRSTPAAETNPERSQEHTLQGNGALDGGQCSGVLKLVQRAMNNTITLLDDYGADCTIGETKRNRELVLNGCDEGHWCGVIGEVRPYKRSDDPTGLHVFVNDVLFAVPMRNWLPQPKQENSPSSKPADPIADTKSASDEGAYELELRSLGSKNVNEGVTRERYVLHSYLQLTNVSDRAIKIEEWWINRRRGAPLCSKTTEVEDSLLNEAAKLKRETGKDISGLLGRQLRSLQPGEFLTLDVNNDHCGSVFRVDVRTDRQTEFWTVQ
ncbi:hypothetical protein ACVWZL_007368 [Bradyrhizobium sp. GM2.4]